MVLSSKENPSPEVLLTVGKGALELESYRMRWDRQYERDIGQYSLPKMNHLPLGS